MDADEDSFKTESSSENKEDHWLEEGEIEETETLQFSEKKLLDGRSQATTTCMKELLFAYRAFSESNKTPVL